ncbi:MAG: hemolysin III family protein [Desulfarculus sp.]|nr:hemolysin III family protein [Desulfarculus sp.]
MTLSAGLKDPFSALSHLTGALLSALGLTLLVVCAALYASAWHVVSFAVYGAAMVLLYTSSGLYHALRLGERGTRRMRRLDHIMIYLLIAGTYTPVCLVPLRGAWGFGLLATVWGLALAGIVCKLFWLEAPRRLSTALYLGLGWLALVAIYPLVMTLPWGGLAWLGLGGLCYSLGAVVYAMKRPDPWPGRFGFHEIWHLMVMAGSFCHFWLMYAYVLRLG